MDRTSSGTTPIYRTKAFTLIVGLLVSAGCLWWAVREMLQDPQAIPQILTAFRRADYRSLPVLLLILWIFYWLKAWRWRLLLLPVGRYHPNRDLFPPIMMGFAFNNLLPAHLGEFVRCLVFARQQNLSLTASLSSVVLERVFDIIAILFYLGLGLAFVSIPDPTINATANFFALGAACCVAGGLVFVVWTKPFVALMEAVLGRIPFIPQNLNNKICRLLEGGAAGLASLKDWRLLLAITAISLVKWALNGLLILISVWSFGLPVTMTVAFVLLGVVAFGVTVPSSPGYFGVIQLCFMKVLGLFINQQEAIFAASIYYHLSQYIVVTLLGLYFFNRTGLSFAQVEAAEEQFEESAGSSLAGEAEPIVIPEE